MNWNNRWTVWIARLLMPLTLLAAMGGSAAAFNFPDNASYGYFSKDYRVAAPEAFTLQHVLTLTGLGLKYQGQFVDEASYGGRLFLLDKQDGLVIAVDDMGKLSAVLGKQAGLSQPEGLFISGSGMIYIADTGNGRIVKMDTTGKVRAIVPAPAASKTMSSVEYAPIHVVVDAAERLYVIVRADTNGIYQINMKGEFLGYFGSVPVVPSATELLWRMVSTKEQRARMLLFVPTEYSNMDIDASGFIYTTVATNTDTEMLSFIQSGGSNKQLAPIRRLNPKGKDILVRAAGLPPAGDIQFPTSTTRAGNASRFIDIAVSNDGFYSVLDSTYSRVFTYDANGDLLYLFGNNDDSVQGLKKPVALCYWGDRIAVVDQDNAAVKVYAPTAYAQTVGKAVLSEQQGNYKEAAAGWNSVLSQYSISHLAYEAKGREAMRDKNYGEAMRWFRKADDQSSYSEAFRMERQQSLTKTMGWIILTLALVCAGIFVLRRRLKKHPIGKMPDNRLRKCLRGVRYGLYIMRHPFDGFWDMQFEKRGNPLSATVILALATTLSLITITGTGYLVSGSKTPDENLLVRGILGVIVPVGLWCIANWSVTTLMNGSGTITGIYMLTCYSLMPLLLFQPLLIVMSHVITTDELALYGIIQTIAYLWAGFLLFSGTLVVHQYAPRKTIATMLVTVVAIAVILFLFLLCMTILQQMVTFIQRLYQEIQMRI